MKPSPQPRKPLTEVELEMMNILWRVGPCTVKQMLESLSPGRALAYTSVSTMVRILEQKDYVRASKLGRGHLYEAAVSKESYQEVSIDHVVKTVFDGAPSDLVRHLLQSDQLSQEELAEIRAMLDQRTDP